MEPIEERFKVSSDIFDFSYTLSESSEFAIILHPIRYAILRALVYYSHIPRSELRKIIDITSGSLERHLDSLKERKLIDSEYEFLRDKPRKVVYINQKGINLFTSFVKNLESLIYSIDPCTK